MVKVPTLQQIYEAFEIDDDGNLTVTKPINLRSAVEAVSGASATVVVNDTGKTFVQTASSGTTTFTLPAAEAGLEYTFVCGNAGGEILINVQTGDAIVTKIHAAENGTALAPAAGTGIRNTAGTNVAGDCLTLVALDGTTWYGTGMTGVWASQ